MPFVDISLARGKSAEYIEGVSRAVHQALVGELGVKPDDNFQIIHQYEPGEMVFNRTFRGGPRSDDWIVFQITDDPTAAAATPSTGSAPVTCGCAAAPSRARRRRGTWCRTCHAPDAPAGC